jgi:HEXXH motif-containing protein
MNAADLLWNDDELYQARYQKTASALIAIAQALERNHPLDGDEAEFLELFQRVSVADPDAFTIVWRDPTAYFWVRLAYEFVGNCLAPAPLSSLAETVMKARGNPDSKSALKAHLGDFRRFVLALGVVADTDQSFVVPLEVTLPFAIPSTRWVLDGRGKLLIKGFAGSHLVLTRAGHDLRMPLAPASHDSLTIRESPVAVADDYALKLQPEAFNLPGLKEGELLQNLPPPYQSEQVDLTAQALELIRRHAPASFEHFREVIRLAALKPSELGDYSNISHSDLPGSFIVTVVKDPYVMADFFIHEFHHNRFFFVEERGAFFADERDNRMTRGEFYSPFRDDLRPLHGLFHGLYVFLAVWRFWYAVYRSNETAGMRRGLVSEQVTLYSIQIAIAVAQLRRFTEFAPLGAQLFEAMAQESVRIERMTRDLKLPANLPAIRCGDDGMLSVRHEDGSDRVLTVQRKIFSHAEQYDVHHQCTDLESIIAASFDS